MEFSKNRAIRKMQIIIERAREEGWSPEELSKALSKPKQFFGRPRNVKLNLGKKLKHDKNEFKK